MQKSVPAANHKHIIGFMHKQGSFGLVTMDDLRSHIRDQKEFNSMLMRDPCFSELKWMLRPEYTLRDYGDWRCSTGLHRFAHCPDCGLAINWKKIRDTHE